MFCGLQMVLKNLLLVQFFFEDFQIPGRDVAAVILFTGLLSVRRVVNYISALQNEPGNSDTSDVEDHEVHCRSVMRSTPHHLNLNCSAQNILGGLDLNNFKI
ncbi:putative undecaprenyl diphosphate synthase [Trichinella spiralis]|nr:putative undecaprenyl diphosphate synthase [Trichinella spiralis]